MSENWIIYEKNEFGIKKCWIEEINYNLINERLKIILRDTSVKTNIFEITFDSTILYYDVSDESTNLALLNDLISLYGEVFLHKSTIFEIKNSHLVKELVEKGCDVISEPDLIHIVIMSVDTFVNIVSYGYPAVGRVSDYLIKL